MNAKPHLLKAIRNARDSGRRHITVPVEMLEAALSAEKPARESTADPPSRSRKRKETASETAS